MVARFTRPLGRGCFASFAIVLEFPGGRAAGDTPVPIPNTEVKPRRADDTVLATVWESRSLPGLNFAKRAPVRRSPFYLRVSQVGRERNLTRGAAIPRQQRGRS